VSCDECVEAFASGLSGVALQIEVDTRFPQFQCEACSVSSESPGKVEAEENVVFLTIHPIHYDDKTGVLSPIAFEQLTRNDLSLLRRDHATIDQFDHVLNRLLNGGSGKIARSINLCCCVSVDYIRAMNDGNGRVFGIYDTAISDLPAHASVFVRRDYLETSSARKEARRLALAVFGPKLMPLAEVMPSPASSSEPPETA
jgi:hypothetical protein